MLLLLSVLLLLLLICSWLFLAPSKIIVKHFSGKIALESGRTQKIHGPNMVDKVEARRRGGRSMPLKFAMYKMS